MKRKDKNITKSMNIKILIAFILGIVISITSSYVLADTLVKSEDVYYDKTSSGLAVNNVQAAIDGTCTKFSNQLQEFLLKVYPIGSIYISYNSTNPETLFGGTWEAYGKGQTLVGIDTNQTEFNTVGKTGGEKTVTLSTENLPAHTHDISHTHKTASTTTSTVSLTAQSATPKHTVTVKFHPNAVKKVSGGNIGVHSSSGTSTTTNPDSLTITGGAHTHSVTGTVTIPSLSTNSISTSISGSTGSGTAFSTLDPYITVYMWRRTA